MSCSKLVPLPTTLNFEHQNEFAISPYIEANRGKDNLTTEEIFSFETNMNNFDLTMPLDDVCFTILSILAQSPTIWKTQGLSVIYIICKCLAVMWFQVSNHSCISFYWWSHFKMREEPFQLNDRSNKSQYWLDTRWSKTCQNRQKWQTDGPSYWVAL